MNFGVLRTSILVSVCLFATTPVVRSQATTSGDRTLNPPRIGLVAVHLPDLSTLEKGVREQLTAEQDSLAAMLKTPGVSDAVLSDAYGKLGQVYHAYSLTAPARDCYFNATALAPNDFRWIYLTAKLDQHDGQFEAAIGRFSLARSLRPDYVAASVNLGNMFLELNRLSDAEGAFAKALEIEKNNPAALYGMGQVSAANRKYAEAVRYFEQTLAQVPGANRVHYSLAMAYRGLGNAEKAKIHLAQQGTVGVRVSDPLVDGLQDLIAGERVYLSRGKIAFEARRYAEAANEFRKAVAIKPDSVTARVNLGAALSQTGDLKGAAEQFEEVLRLEPGKATAHYNLGIILAVQNKHEEAIAHLRSVLSVEPNDTTARFLLAQQLNKSGKADEALIEYSRVVEVNPANESALLELVILLYRKRQFKTALEGLERSYAQYPQRGQTVVLLAYVLAASPQIDLRNGARALDLAQRVYAASSTPQYGALVALGLAELGRCSEAADWQRRVIAAAEQDQNKNADLLVKLRAGLKHYENAQSCRPANETILADLLMGTA
jgi:tetratricopeptide (TPR) repeat protein